MFATLAITFAFAGAAVGKQPKVKDKIQAKITGTTLTVSGTNGDDDITLRLHAGDPTRLDIDDGAGRILTFSFAAFTSVVVNASAAMTPS